MERTEIEKLINEVIASKLENLTEEFFQPATETLTNEIRDYVASMTDGVDKRIKSLEKTRSPESQSSEAGTESPLDARVKDLEARLQEAEERRVTQEKEASALRFDNTLSATLDEFSPLHKNVVHELLRNRFKDDVTENDNQWLTKKGRTLKEATEEFFGTDEGKHFLASSHRDGAGTKEPEKQRPIATQISTGQALREAFVI